MEEHIIGNKLYAHMFYSLATITLIASIFFYNPWVLLLAASLISFSAVYYSSGHIVNNLLLRRSLVIETYNGYALSDNLLSAVKKVGNQYLSVSVAVLRLNRGIEVKDGEILGLLEGIGEPFWFTLQLREINKKTLLESLETKRRMKEIAAGRVAGSSYDRANAIKREIGLVEQEINSIRGSGKALEISIQLRTSETSGDESDAARGSAKSLERVAASFSTVLNADYEMLKGEALLSGIEAF